MNALSMTTAAQANRYLTFRLGDGSFGVPVADVREIIRMLPITSVPGVPGDVRGVVDLRDRVIAVVDLRQRLGLGRVEPGPRTCIVVVDASAVAAKASVTGLLVDDVEEVLEIPPSQLSDAPAIGDHAKTNWVCGHARVRDGLKTLLDLGLVLGAIGRDEPCGVTDPWTSKAA